MSRPGDDSALVLLSGGQDSATCLAWALDRFDRVETIGFDYGQRHRVELDCRIALRETMASLKPSWAARLGADHLLDLPTIHQLGATAMTSEIEIGFETKGLPNTFVPGRNLLFFTLAGALGLRRGIRHHVGGMCETDYSGYPDCRDDTIKALQVALNLGLDANLVLHTPLMWIDKRATWALAETLGGPALIDLLVEHSHTCYRGDREQRHDWGYGCNSCPACELRSAGWQAFSAARHHL